MSQHYLHEVEPPVAPLARPVVAFMTDFGLVDGYVGVMKGVVLGIAPGVQLLDITHSIAPQDIFTGAWVLGTSYRYFPKGTVFVCVVDPGVGSARRPVVLHAGNWFFVGPDNGLFGYVLAEEVLHEVVALSNPVYHLPQVSSTFHGRDVFSPVAAHLALGVSLTTVGTAIDPSSLESLPIARATRQGERVTASIVHVDQFGNLITNIPLALVPELFNSSTIQLTFTTSNVIITERSRFFAGASGNERAKLPFIYGDSSGYVAVAVCNDNAARILGIDRGTDCVLLIMK
ncbi:MAG TPA: SAM-dependent chlorinase/fluorinase [Ktedonobacteraceae bacterium]|nr:SAM-dependent chlorinase/fluorinase [Ktedonobacteraceae bacterium]